MEIFQAILTGLILGVSTLVFIGPVLFFLIQSSVHQGRSAGYLCALGIILGDFIYVLLILNGFAEWLQEPVIQKYGAFTGSILLFDFGFKNIFKPAQPDFDSPNRTRKFQNWGPFLKAFVLNFVNPFVALVWIGFLSVNQSQFDQQILIWVSLSTTLLVIFSTDLLKAHLAHKLQQWLTSTRMKTFSRVVGIIMILFACRLLYAFISM